VWVIDSTPEVLEVGDAWRMLPLMRSLPREFATREAGYAALKERGLDDATAQWLAMNIHRTEEGRYRMVLDPDRLEPLLRDFYDRDLWEVVEEPPAGVMIHFVRASRQSVMSDGAAERIREIGRRTDQVVLHEVAGGHWLHVDAPEAVVQVITSSLCG
jgi:pimeloyl-ACP methyl ester carboxylesterase